MILWIDTETTGLEPGCILEIAAVLTTDELDEVSRFHRLVCADDPVTLLNDSEPIVREMHVANGLAADICNARIGGDRTAEFGAVSMFRSWAEPLVGDTPVPLGGNTPSFDRMFLLASGHRSRAFDFLSHRHVDVSCLNELARRWAPTIYAGRPQAAKAHRAMADIENSIATLAYYRAQGFIGKDKDTE